MIQKEIAFLKALQYNLKPITKVIEIQRIPSDIDARRYFVNGMFEDYKTPKTIYFYLPNDSDLFDWLLVGHGERNVEL